MTGTHGLPLIRKLRLSSVSVVPSGLALVPMWKPLVNGGAGVVTLTVNGGIAVLEEAAATRNTVEAKMGRDFEVMAKKLAHCEQWARYPKAVASVGSDFSFGDVCAKERRAPP